MKSFPKPPSKNGKGNPPLPENAGSNLVKASPKLIKEDEKLKDLNFKVPAEFAKQFKMQAVQEGLTMVDLLRKLFSEYTDNR